MDKKKRPVSSLLAFMADLHHEIRSPVNTILNMTELAVQENPTPAVRHYIDTIEKSASSLLTILDDIIELSQDDMDSHSGNQPFGITDLLEDLKDAIDGPLKAKKTHMGIQFDEDLPEWFTGPRGRIRQVLTQICNYSMRQLFSRDICLKIFLDTEGASIRLLFVLRAVDGAREALEPRDILRNPRILICQRLLVELGDNLKIRRIDDKIEFSFSLDVVPLERPWAEPMFPTPTSCVVGKKDISSELVSRRLKGCGFDVAYTPKVDDAERILCQKVSPSHKGIMLVDWKMFEEEPEAWKALGARVQYPLIYFDIPAIKMMHLSAQMSEQEDSSREIGFVMEPSKGKQVISEVLRLLKMEPEQLSCPFFNDEDSDQEMEIDMEGLKGMKVLVVEDDRINQRIVVELLKKFHIKPVVASTGEAARKAVKKRSFDAIFMDINLPDTDGYRLTEEIRKMDRYRSVPIIALTASTKNRKLCMEAGMDYYLSKPYSETKLLRSLMAARKK